ncbi:hypothetical protein G6F57_010561 [Rhizopus arrhizus]|uniref:rRNA-processing protein n=1 Tax=Rhizopus oryzae TaxID=64495 RepID=A0A9P6X187_RHIOR|nr:hypothetical protein G6F23_006643 [Rhizopus arrhizus]KAG1416702.1 hypothetical protein G6F58_005851 [Rhizopus delemar]KAG0757484.1 hypothetical protein G6F24_010448 [Rhizopus arrhizus]KAG0792746.1 hypothetical protein G6F21_004129 [Rhizopus arrhizus]KAG0798891.1 hypothetical protein G6F22_003771 [Rhizopus arrhizus]
MSTVNKDSIQADKAGVVDTINKRISGKIWKIQKKAAVRTQQPKQLRRTWDERTKERERNNAMKALEKQLKQEKQDEIDRKKQANLERKRIKEEKERQEALAAKMSAKRLARLKKREARKKARI